MNIEKELFKLQDKKYQEFQKKLCPENDNIIGIRIPVLRKFAKENKDKIDINELNFKYYEEIMLRGMLLGMQENLDLEDIKKFIPLIDNWAVCDTFCAGLEDDYIDFILKELSKIDSEKYYTNMAIAWCYAECFIKYYDRTLKFFESNKLKKFVRNKSIQKAIESYRLTNSQKEVLRKLKV